MNTTISFRGRYFFLSNFHTAPVDYWSITFPTVEHAYQAGKTPDVLAKKEVARLSSPGLAKKWGRTVVLPENWYTFRVHLMAVLVMQKFVRHESLAIRLIETADTVLIEGNHWHDNFWGDCRCFRCVAIEGQNHLGQILMHVREYFDWYRPPPDYIQ